MIETWPCHQVRRSDILALFAVIQLKCMYCAKSFIAPAIHLFSNGYFQANDHHSLVIYIELKLSVKKHKEAGETLRYFVVDVLRFCNPAPVDCIDRHYDVCRMLLSLLSCTTQCRNIWHNAHLSLLWAFWIINAIVLRYI
jgi:hypothetical protein